MRNQSKNKKTTQNAHDQVAIGFSLTEECSASFLDRLRSRSVLKQPTAIQHNPGSQNIAPT